ncbi:MAG: hypothetical protein ACRDSR_25570 [Pseudonocardiaceae bacterium]
MGAAVLLGFAGAEAGAAQVDFHAAPRLLAVSALASPTNPPGPCDPDEIGQTRAGPDGRLYQCVPSGTGSGSVNNSSKGTGGSSQEPPRFTSNSRQSRTYGNGVADIRGQADGYARKMQGQGFDTSVGALRIGKYGDGRGDITVAVYKKGSDQPVHIRHFITKDRIQ